MDAINKYLKEIQQDFSKIRYVGGAVVYKVDGQGNKNILLIQRSSDDHFPLYFDIPRGGCDYGKQIKETKEPIIPCIIRECKEETGLDIVPIKYLDKFSYYNNERKILTIETNYLCKMKDVNQKIKLSKEHQGYTWIQSLGQAELLLLPELKRTLSLVFDSLVTYEPNTIQTRIEE